MTFKTLALTLFGLGYPVLPASGKRILIDGWTTLVIDGVQVEYWANNGQAKANIGVRTGDDSVGGIPLTMADIDITDRDLARVVCAALEARFGGTVERRGQAPKRGLIYAMDGVFSKIRTVLIDPEGRKHALEWMALGQQFIAEGIHPDTKRPYTYRDKSLADVEPWELPLVSEAGIRAWLADVLPGLLPEGWRIEVAAGNSAAITGEGLDTDERALLNFKPKLDMEWDVVVSMVMALDANIGHDEWVKVMMAIHHQSGGSDVGLALAHDWSKLGATYRKGEVDAKWRSIKDDPSRGRVVSMASVVKLVREDGIAPEKKAEISQGWSERVAECADEYALQRLIEKDIAKDKTLGPVDLAKLEKTVKDKFVELGIPMRAEPLRKLFKGGQHGGRSPLPDMGSDGGTLQTAANLKTICDNLGVTIRYNVIKKEDEILIPGEAWSVDNSANASLAWLIDACHREEMRTSDLKAFVTMLADQNQFNPVMQWIESKPWDGVSRLADFYATVTERPGEITPGLKEIFMLRWMISAIKAVADPEGVAAQGVLVFQGIQYAGKTRWLKSLAPTFYRFIHEGLTLDPKNKDSVKIAISHWIVELGELDATFRKADVSALKAFITQPFDIMRKPYAMSESQFARRTVFGASVNEEKFLHDPTGNRRFWTIPVKQLNHDHGLDMQQVWAEVLTLYMAGEQHFLTPDEMLLLNYHNEDFTSVSPIVERVQVGFDWDGFADRKVGVWMTITEALIKIGVKNPTRAETIEAGREIKKRNGGNVRKSNGKQLSLLPLRHIDINEGVGEWQGNHWGNANESITPEEIPF